MYSEEDEQQQQEEEEQDGTGSGPVPPQDKPCIPLVGGLTPHRLEAAVLWYGRATCGSITLFALISQLSVRPPSKDPLILCVICAHEPLTGAWLYPCPSPCQA
jgi:hypothetical protein